MALDTCVLLLVVSEPPPFKFASSLISVKWTISFSSFPAWAIQAVRARGRKSLYSMRAFHFYFLQPRHPPPFPST